MSFVNFMIRGPSMKGGIYNYHNYAAKPKPEQAEIEKIRRLWNTFKTSSLVFLLSTVGGIVAGAFLLPGMPIFGLALTITSAALTVFCTIRLLSAIDQVSHWHEIGTPKQTSKVNSVVYADIIKKAKECESYFKTLQIPSQDQNNFVTAFLDTQMNPLQYFQKHVCPAKIDKTVEPASKIYRQLCTKHHFFLSSSLPNACRRAQEWSAHEHEMIKKRVELKTDLNDHALNLLKKYGKLQPEELVKKEAIHNYVASLIQIADNQAHIKADENLAMDLTALQKAKVVHQELFFNKIVAFVEAYRKKDLASITEIDSFKDPKWNNYKFELDLKNLPFNAAKLPGITEAEFQLYLSKC